MANSTYRNIQDNVLALISKSDSTTRNRVKTWINMGYQDFVLRELWPFRETTDTITTVAGTQEYTLSSEFSDIDAQNITSVALQGDVQSKLTYWPFTQLRANRPDFDLDGSSVPTRYYLKNGKIGFWPTPADAYTVAIDYYKIPTELDADSDVTIVPLAYREALMQYALSLEHDFNTDPDLAQKAMNRYEQIVALARNNLLTQPNDTEAFRILGPADSRNHTGLYGELA
jgi:hypothetical protein